MQDEKSSTKYKEILDELQVQSWQLELVISGFAIFGLFSALEPLQEFASINRIDGNPIQSIFLSTIHLTCILAIFNLILHVLLRGLWIGAVGIRSVSGDIDFEELNMSKVFKKHLKGKIGSFDKYIINLENYSSILFGVTFLIAFIIISISINFLIFLGFIFFLMENDFLPFEVKATLSFIVFPILLIGYLITIIDFIIPGIVKRSQDVAKVYLPIYKVFSVLTLSFIYRPILYNLLDNKFGKKIIYSLIPIYGLLVFVFSSEMNPSNFLSLQESSTTEIANRINYKDMLEKKGSYLKNTAIQSKIITEPFLEITLPYNKKLEDEVTVYDSVLKPETDERGYQSILSSIRLGPDQDTTKIKTKDYLATINEMFHFQIDCTKVSSNLVVVSNEDKRLQLEMLVDLINYDRGKHILIVKHKEFKSDSVATKNHGTIPFWYFPENNTRSLSDLKVKPDSVTN